MISANSSTCRVAFYAPLKPPDHPIPSGDREIARLILKALELSGFEVELMSRFISYQKRPSANLFAERRSAGEDEADHVLKTLLDRPRSERPDIWLSYHPYCKAPDWLGPLISSQLQIPYTIVEACRTRQDSDADWQAGRDIVQAGIRQAAVNFCTKLSDFDYLQEVLVDQSNIVRLSPFLDFDAASAPQALGREVFFTNDAPVILAVGMMRPNAKFESYRMLADALRLVKSPNWNLLLVGDGPERKKIEYLFSFLPPQRRLFAGSVMNETALGLMQQSDIFAWPGYREAIGMVFLEAGANGLPIVAMRSLGVPQVVADGVTGVLVEEGDVAGYARALDSLLEDATMRERFGKAAKSYVRERHDITTASQTFKNVFDKLLAQK